MQNPLIKVDLRISFIAFFIFGFIVFRFITFVINILSLTL